MNSDGFYTFTPLPTPASMPVITYTVGNLTFSSTATLTISVNPVSDARPGLLTDVTTNEDTIVALNLKMPVITDNTDKNGAPAETTQNGSVSSLESIDTERRFTRVTARRSSSRGNNTMRIVIVDSGGGPDSSVYYTNLTLRYQLCPRQSS
ncbi:hypothetical protein MASR1M66_11470 [Aminivibrio sp.]